MELGWQAYRAVAHCLHLQMWAFEHALPRRLNETEWQQFRLAFTATEMFAQFPLLLLSKRLSMIQPLLLRILDGSDPSTVVPVIHRVLSYYVLMARGRRDTDRRRRT
ncbi:MAG: hypothetical protein HQ518_15580 [Rhodopirellula sp.]|nr:hypothetical protein [Rhodopirellula sp.]